MRLTLPHQTTQQEAIKKIDTYLSEMMKQKFPGITVIDPEKTWENNIMRFSFGVSKMFLDLEFSGLVIVTDQEVIGEAEVPGIVTTFVSEEKIKSVIKQRFNELFNIK
ncbi:MAG: hypothetical protein WC675_01115 [Patescibacteria group bacterium]|jgi:hypothetical protein